MPTTRASPAPDCVVSWEMGPESSSTSDDGAYWSRKSRIAVVVASPCPKTPSRDTSASSAGKMDSTAKYVKEAARSVHPSFENSARPRLKMYPQDRPWSWWGESGFESWSGCGAASFRRAVDSGF